MNNNEIIDKIRSTYPNIYPDNKVDNLRLTLGKMSPVIKKALVSFLENGNHEEIILLGYSVEKLVKEHGMNEYAAYATLDWIIREPERAVGSLKKGHDIVKAT